MAKDEDPPPATQNLRGPMASRTAAGRGPEPPAAAPSPPTSEDIVVSPPIQVDGQKEVVAERYQLERHVGRGGMGEVYAATDLLLGKRVALKRLNKTIARDEGAVKRFLAEAPAAARVGHPNIVDVTNFGSDGEGAPFYVMELLEGKTLHDEIWSGVAEHSSDNGKPLSIERALHITRQILDALATAHEEARVVHRDLKPANIMLVKRGAEKDFVKILDFGIAKSLEGNAQELTQEGHVVGTPAYLAPEVPRGEATRLDPRVDIYSVGAMLFEMLCGDPPWGRRRTTNETIMALVAAKTPPELRGHGTEVPPLLSEFVLQALAVKPSDRFPSAKSMLAALEEVWKKLVLGESENPLTSEELAALPAGIVVARDFRIDGPGQAGAMGIVYPAWDLGLARKCALKFLLPSETGYEAEILERFARDGRLAASVVHPHVVAVYTRSSWRGCPFIAMEYIEGQPLRAAWAEWSWERFLRCLGELARAVDAIHAQGIVHRDLTPGNVLVEASGATKLIDFGIARITGSTLTRPSSSFVLGTWGYMAPEQAGFGGDISTATDRWSLAALVYEALVGRAPFYEAGEDVLDPDVPIRAAERLGEGRPPTSIRQSNRTVPEAVDKVVIQGLAFKPEERYRSASEFVAALATTSAPHVRLGVATEREASVAADEVAQNAKGALPKRRMRQFVLAGAVSVAILGAVAMVLQRSAEPVVAPSPSSMSGSVPPPATSTLQVQEEPSPPVRKGSVMVKSDAEGATLLIDGERFVLPTLLSRPVGTAVLATAEFEGEPPQPLSLVVGEEIQTVVVRFRGQEKQPAPTASSGKSSRPQASEKKPARKRPDVSREADPPAFVRPLGGVKPREAGP